MNGYRIDARTPSGAYVVTYTEARSLFHALAVYHVQHPDDTVVGIRVSDRPN